MAHLTDSNLLLRSMQPGTPLYAQANRAVTTLLGRGEEMPLVPQCLIEFWNVASRPTQVNGLGLPLADVQQEVQRLKQIFTLLPDTPAIYPTWERIVTAFSVQGRQVHDARLVAAMQVHGITHILTFNTADFLRYQPLGITVVHPASV